MSTIGIIYFIQPAELVTTNRYKIGCSNKNTLDRCKTGYRCGSRYLCIMECANPMKLENIIKICFRNRFKLIAGNEYFEGDENEMLNEFVSKTIEYINTPLPHPHEQPPQSQEQSQEYTNHNIMVKTNKTSNNTILINNELVVNQTDVCADVFNMLANKTTVDISLPIFHKHKTHILMDDVENELTLTSKNEIKHILFCDTVINNNIFGYNSKNSENGITITSDTDEKKIVRLGDVYYTFNHVQKYIPQYIEVNETCNIFYVYDMNRKCIETDSILMHQSDFKQIILFDKTNLPWKSQTNYNKFIKKINNVKKYTCMNSNIYTDNLIKLPINNQPNIFANFCI